MATWTLKRRSTPYRGRVVRLHVDEVLYRGRRITRENIIHPGAAAIIPICDNGDILLVRQLRYAVGKRILEIPAGTLEAGERPRNCAKRELEEETGYRPGTLRRLGMFYPVPGYSTEQITIYEATDLRPSVQHLDHDEDITLERMTQKRVRTLLRTGRIVDAKTLVALLYYFGDTL
jgi:8-oxo-dGTP pyrophosphatase MutT (NUDIX family)